MKEMMMVKPNNSAKKRYRFLASLLAVVLMLGCMMIPDTQAQASSLSLGVSASSVKIGDTVTVSITVPAGVSATVNVTYPSGVFSFSSASDTANANGGTVSMTIGSYGSTNTKTTGTMKFKAKAAGSATFSASAPIAGNQDGDRVSVGGASASVRVKNEANEDSNSNSNNSNNNNNSNSNDGNNAGDGEDNSHKSADNSLASLTLSAGSLSPAFKYNVTNYTAEVANDVTSVVVSAKPSNAKATVESVKGGENLAVGANKIQIVVKAENGVTATYTINVTRKEAGAADEPDTPDADEPDNTDEPQEQCFEIGGVKMYPSEDGDETQIPEGFALSEITLWESAYPYWVNDKIGTDIGLIYLVDANKENGAWYRISEASPYEAEPFVCFRSEYGYIIATPEKMTEAAPAGYAAETVNIEGKGIVDAYVKDGDENDCLIYAVNQDGTYGLYRYDMQDRTYMRYTESAQVADTQVSEPSTELPKDQVNDLESQNRLLFYAFIVVVAILLIVIVILVVKRKHDDDDDDEEDEWDEEDELDLSDERAGASKRYDRSEFLTGDEAAENAGTESEDAQGDAVAEKTNSQSDTVTRKSSVSTNTLDLEAVLAQAVSETLNDTTDVKPQDADSFVSSESGMVAPQKEIDSDEHAVAGEVTVADEDAVVDEETAADDVAEETVRPAKRHKKKSYREELKDAMDDFDDEDDFDFDDEEDEEEEKPKKKKEKRGLFGRRKKKNEDEDDDIEFLDL